MHKKRLVFYVVLAWAVMACLAAPALAQESGCQAVVSLMDGSTARVSQILGSPVGDVDPIASLVVQTDQGLVGVKMADLKSITRLSPPGPTDTGMLRFAYVTVKGGKGEFSIQEEYGLQGALSLGVWSTTMDKVKAILFHCAP